MLTHTFRHLPGVGEVTERALWDSGIRTWADFLDANAGDLPVRARPTRFKRDISECAAHLDAMDSAYFARKIRYRDSWRLYADFRHNAAFLDIETTGLSPERSIVTLVGILDRDGYHSFVYDQNLSDLREAIEKYDLIVTYNGASFDLPFIERRMGRMFAHTPHIDIMYPLRWAGYKGGLKAIEQRLGVGRPSALSELSGYDAVRMWRMWQRGSKAALETLIRYNAEDVFSLPKLAEIAYNELAERLNAPASALAPQQYPETELPYDADVIAALRGRGW